MGTGDEGGATPAAAGEPQVEDVAAGVPMSKVYFDRSLVLVVICVFAILFWVGFEQAANVMNLWADKHTNLHVFQGTAPQALGDRPHDSPDERGSCAAEQQRGSQVSR